jgi:ABC-type multidrug transport system ATPase subunit
LLNEVERAADKVGIIHRGRQRFEGNLKLLQSRVKKIKVQEGSIVPAGFEAWQVLDRSANDPEGIQEMVVDAPPEVWASSGLPGESLPLDDIFISCVGVEAKRI